MPAVCDKCGAETEIPEAFFTQRKSFRQSTRTECPRCYSESQLAGLKKKLLWSLAIGVISVVLVMVAPRQAGGWILLNLFFFDVSLIATIVPHEFGHAFVARWLGLRVFKVYVGFGRTMFARNLFGFRTEFRSIPFGGLTLATPVDTSWFRLKQFAFTLAGPFANLLLCGVVLLFVPFEEVWNFGSLTEAAMPGRVFLYANLIVLVQNLWPHKFDSPIGKLSNDGKLLWETLFLKRDTIDDHLAARFTLEAMECNEKQQYSAALVWIEQGLAHHPDNILLLNWRGNLLIECKQYEAARDCFSTLLARTDNPPAVRAMMLNNIAYVDALLGGTDRLTEADRYSQEAMSLLGWMPAVKGTRGTTLLEIGRIEDALPLLHQSMEQAEHSSGKAQNACFIAMGEARRGNLAESRKYLDEARRLAPTCFLLERAETAIREATAGSSA